MNNFRNYTKNMFDLLEDIFRKINPSILLIVLILILGFNYKIYQILQRQNLAINNRINEISKLRLEIDNTTKTVNDLQSLKTNILYLNDKVDAINTVKTILQQHNIDYTLNIDVPESATTGKYFQGLSDSSNSFIEGRSIISKNAKMGVFHYIPSQIIIKNYINYKNLTNTINELIKNNFIITQIYSKAKFAHPQSLVLGGRLYVSE